MNQRRRGAPTTKQVSKRLVALAGNPNSGKTTVFNALTGLRQKVGNYAGVTVEKKLGLLTLPDGTTIEILDLPGAYSLTARSPEEQIARNVLLGEVPDTPRPDLVVLVVDGSNLERNLYLATQVLDMGLPAIIALNMMDVAQGRGLQVDAAQLERWLGVPVVPLIASKGVGIDRLKELIARSELPRPPARRWKAAPEVEEAIQTVAQALRRTGTVPEEAVEAEAIRLIGLEGTPSLLQERGGPGAGPSRPTGTGAAPSCRPLPGHLRGRGSLRVDPKSHPRSGPSERSPAGDPERPRGSGAHPPSLRPDRFYRVDGAGLPDGLHVGDDPRRLD